MSKTNQIDIKKLSLDLKNFRTVPQKSEVDAVNAMISISPDRFWALMDSIIEDGYIPTENIIAIKNVSNTDIIVKEGNRRIAVLKLIHGYLNTSSFYPPASLLSKISGISADWKKENSKVPCTIYETKDIDKVDKIVNLTHGKGDKASRDKWTSVATARHNRDMNKASEPSLDLLEKYFINGKNITEEQKEKWSGDYPITVLEEAMKKIFPRVEEANIMDMVKKYPKIKHKDAVDKILSNIGLHNIGFKEIRNPEEDFGELYGLPKPILQSVVNSHSTPPTPDNSTASTGTGSSSASSPNSGNNNQSSGVNNNATPASQNPQNTAGQNSTTISTTSAIARTSVNKAYAINDPRGVQKLLKAFSPSGLQRQKVVTLRDEALNLKLSKNPIAFCFLLRSMFEISVKAYFTDHSLVAHKAGGKEKTLKELLNEAKIHLTNNGQNKILTRELHGAITELSKTEGILSVTSMNQLVHSPTFSVTESDICTLFGKIFPLLKSLN